jgi:hypothetical protein
MVHEATDPRDKVYALFGLLGADIEALVEPKCQIDATKLFRIIARAIYTDDEDFRHFSNNPHKDPIVRLSGLPS